MVVNPSLLVVRLCALGSNSTSASVEWRLRWANFQIAVKMKGARVGQVHESQLIGKDSDAGKG